MHVYKKSHLRYCKKIKRYKMLYIILPCGHCKSLNIVHCMNKSTCECDLPQFLLHICDKGTKYLNIK